MDIWCSWIIVWIFQAMRTTIYTLEEQRNEIRGWLINYIKLCAQNRIERILDGDINDVLLAIKGEISMASMEGRIDLVQSISSRFEELACIEIDISRLREQDAILNYSNDPINDKN